MTRVTDWEARLAAHIEAASGEAYQLGKHDCAWFAAGAVEAVTGANPWPKKAARYASPKGQAKALAAFGWQTLDDACDALLGPRIPPLAAHRGDIVSDGSALGVMTATGPLFFGEDGMAQVAVADLVTAWVVGRCDG